MCVLFTSCVTAIELLAKNMTSVGSAGVKVYGTLKMCHFCFFFFFSFTSLKHGGVTYLLNIFFFFFCRNSIYL